MILYNIRRFVNNFLIVFYFYLLKKCRVLYFSVPSELLLGFLKYDIIETISLKIETARTSDLDAVLSKDLHNIDELKEILKIGWLIKSISSEGIKNPIQLLKRGDLYFCHPGTNRILVSCYILPQNKINGVYLWYKDLDEDPFILSYSREIKNPLEFISLYTRGKYFRFACKTITKNLDVSDITAFDKKFVENPCRSGKAMFQMVKKCFLETIDHPEHLFIMGWDSMHWEETKNMKLKDVINFIDDTTCIYGNVLFRKLNNMWITDKEVLNEHD